MSVCVVYAFEVDMTQKRSRAWWLVEWGRSCKEETQRRWKDCADAVEKGALLDVERQDRMWVFVCCVREVRAEIGMYCMGEFDGKRRRESPSASVGRCYGWFSRA